MSINVNLLGRMHEMTDLELVKRVAALYVRAGWIQGNNATTWMKKPCRPTDAWADCFCLRGACLRVLSPDAGLLATAFTFESGLSMQIARALGFPTNAALIVWNDEDDRTFKDVMELLQLRMRMIPIEERARRRKAKKAAEDKVRLTTPHHRIKKENDDGQ